MEAKGIGEYKIKTFPASRIATFDIGQTGLRKHHVKALIEIDVTEAREKIKQLKKQGKKISFTAWLIKCISIAAEEFGQVHGIRKGKRQVYVFRDVDISIIVEREIDGERVPLPYVIRKTNEKSITDISREIRDAQAQEISDEGDYVLGRAGNALSMKLYYFLPGALRRLIWRHITNNPFLTKRFMGTILITSIGMMGNINGWILPVGIHPLEFGVGSIVKKPGVVGDQIEIREHLFLTVLVDHDVIDGAPAVRVLSKLCKNMERGAGLDE